jgi:predicted nucleic acid-binding protein
LAERTFLDTSVLLAAHHGQSSQRNRCLAIVSDGNRFFVASPFLYLETVPKAIYHKNQQELEFYRTYFDSVRIWINDLESIFRIAREESERCGLAAMDALHVAAAHLGEAEILYTLERYQKPIHRTNLVRVAVVDSEEDPSSQTE